MNDEPRTRGFNAIPRKKMKTRNDKKINTVNKNKKMNEM